MEEYMKVHKQIYSETMHSLLLLGSFLFSFSFSFENSTDWLRPYIDYIIAVYWFSYAIFNAAATPLLCFTNVKICKVILFLT